RTQLSLITHHHLPPPLSDPVVTIPLLHNMWTQSSLSSTSSPSQPLPDSVDAIAQDKKIDRPIKERSILPPAYYKGSV
ncbi:hypothetical protein, partial [Paenibacillus odorifer]|uniref:hypothetical protein n=1 Tax=Paenibacillus odorifer TaxID=189426 RepID=UPI001C4B9051